VMRRDFTEASAVTDRRRREFVQPAEDASSTAVRPH